MSTGELIKNSLNEQQILMLRLFKKPLPDADFAEIRKLAIKLLAKQLDETIDQWESENEISPDYYESMLGKHFRSRLKTH